MPLERPRGFAGAFRVDDDARHAYSESAGILRLVPAAVALPRDVEDLQCLCAWASAEGAMLIPRGSGSSMSGGAVGEGIVVDLHRFRRAPEVRAGWDRVEVGAAVTRAMVDDAARARGLRFPVDPASGPFATLGGMVACNAAGPRTLAFGATRRWVRALDCVFADGTRARVARGDRPVVGAVPALTRWTHARDDLRAKAISLPRRGVRKESSGYGVHDFAATGDLVDLLVGSEGTLAFFHGVELDLIPLPEFTASLLGSWASVDAAAHAAFLAREAGAVACELLDASFLRVAARAHRLPVDVMSESVLLVELEGTRGDDVAARAQALARAWDRAAATDVQLGLDPESEEALWALRHAASPILARLDPHVKSMQVVEDGCVPPGRLGAYVRGVRAALLESGLEGVLFGHAGDAHLHVNALVDVRRDGWREAIRALFDRVTSLTDALGGTMAGEHGDGRLRSALLPRFWSAEARHLFAGIKDVFDPQGILNAGVKMGAPVDPFGAVKYDPALPAHGSRVQRMLDDVEHARSWDSCRLELLDAPG